MLLDTTNFLSPIQSTLLVLENSQFRFSLTGSRYFGGVHSNSDWDFITEHNSEIEQFLTGLGFVLNEDVQDYLDPMTTKVFTKHFCSCAAMARDYREPVKHNDECLKIDIQLCHDQVTKLRVRDILKENFKGTFLPGDKLQRSKLWSMVYHLVKAKE